MKKILSFLFVFVMLFGAIGAAPQTVSAQTPVPTGDTQSEPIVLSSDQIKQVVKSAQEVALTVCGLKNPAVEGLPVDMASFDNWVRQSFCVSASGFEANAWSAWPGSPGTVHPTQDYLAEWVAIRGSQQFLSKRDSVTNNPKTQGPPISLFNWNGHCGGPEDIYVALVRHHAWQDGLADKLELDFSWHFTLPAKQCKLWIPIVIGPPLPPPPPPPPPPSCPAPKIWQNLLDTPADSVLLNYTPEGDTRPFTMQLTQWTWLYTETHGPNGTESLPNGGKTQIFDEAGRLVYEWSKPTNSFQGGVDLGFQTYTVTSAFFVSNTAGAKVKCWNTIRVYDPPAVASHLREINPGLSPDEAMILATSDYKALLDQGLSSTDAFSALAQKMSAQ